ncbi:MAG: cell division ATP-binding protein FtsE [Pseudomonadales bacterium]|nr:cell division ATP-binding protein FtsE [Pseudomonadales bacterium]MCP5183432.1 cell division ATP-binding protein FtsE [Pseudomonadales bacterium]
MELHGVTKRYSNGFEALRDLNVEFGAGSMTFLTGHSGAGKSTFLRMLLRLEDVTRGQLLVNGVNVTQLSKRQLPFYRRHIGAVFQDHHLLAGRSVFDNVATPLRVIGMPEKDIARRVRAALQRVGLLAKEKLLPLYLSTGEQQRVGIARAVVNRPRILLADEPTGNLDPDLSRDIMALFEQFNQVGTTVIVASHDRELIEASGRRIIELAAGRIVSDTPAMSVDMAVCDAPISTEEQWRAQGI